jgi:galactokinase
VTRPAFRELFGRDAEVSAQAPGRVNLIGEHTDYNDGFVLPTTIPQHTHVELARTGDDRVRVWSANRTSGPATYRLGDEARRRDWTDYPQGVTAALAEAGLTLGGFDARIESTIPLGSGLSSSASLLVAVARAVREAFALTLDDVAIARLAHRAETTLVGAPVGVMDQMVCSLGRTGSALLIDTRSLHVAHVPLPSTLDLLVIDSGVHHSHAAGEYRTRRAECEDAAARLGVGSLRDVTLDAAFTARIEALPPPLSRRARHVVGENARVHAFAEALAAADARSLGALLRAGHASLRDDFEVSTPDVDALVDIAAGEPGVVGARMTGGGFGGSIVALAEAGTGRRAAEHAAAAYRARTGRHATVLLPFN